jgi:hypothetical protein
MKRWTVISSVVSTLFVASILTFGVSTEIASAHDNPKKPCTGHHQSDAGCETEPPPPSEASPVIVYLDVNRWRQLMVMDADGGNQTRVYKSTQSDTLQFWNSLTWSPGGTFVAFRAAGSVGVCEWNEGTYMTSLDTVTGEWSPIGNFACINSKPRNGMEFVPTLPPDDSLVQIIWPPGYSVTEDWIATGGLRLSAVFAPGETTGIDIASVEIVARPGDSSDIDRAVLSGGGNWLAYREAADSGSDDTAQMIVIRPFDATVMSSDLAMGDPADVVGVPVATLTAEDAGVTQFSDIEFSMHSDTTLAFAANGEIYCLDFSDSDPSILNLIALTGISPPGTSKDKLAWRPDGTGIIFEAVLNTGTSTAEYVIGEILFNDPNQLGCPADLTNAQFSVLAGGGSKSQSPSLRDPDYWRNAPVQ